MALTLTDTREASVSGRIELEVPSAAGVALTAAEFFAGIGLVRCGLERAGIEVVWANDIKPTKRAVYGANFDASHFVLDDVRNVSGRSVPTVDLATASFPCIDLSLAGHRRGLNGEHSSLFFEFIRILGEMKGRAPSLVLVENVASFASSRGGRDLQEAVAALNDLGYVCDLLIVDARLFTAQSRPRLFIVATQRRVAAPPSGDAGPLRAGRIASFFRENRDLGLQQLPLPPPPRTGAALADAVERLRRDDERWWDAGRLDGFTKSLSTLHRSRLDRSRAQPRLSWRTAYRRTRAGKAMWEIRSDDIAGCLRTARGGSSRQALVEAGHDELRVRWMTPREYARLQGAPEHFDYSAVTESQALYGFGDAVCVPAVEWIARHALIPSAAALSPATP